MTEALLDCAVEVCQRVGVSSSRFAARWRFGKSCLILELPLDSCRNSGAGPFKTDTRLEKASLDCVGVDNNPQRLKRALCLPHSCDCCVSGETCVLKNQ